MPAQPATCQFVAVVAEYSEKLTVCTFGTGFDICVNETTTYINTNTNMEVVMTITRYNPIRTTQYPTVPKSFSNLLDDFFNDVVSSDSGRLYVPNLDIFETDTHYHVQLALPGLKKQDINIDLQDRRLSITGERKEEIEEKNTKYHIRETRYGQFERSVMLPDNINQEKIDARFEDGILKLEIEKREKQVNKQIKVK